MIFYLTYNRLVKTEHACRMHNIDLGEAHMRWIDLLLGLDWDILLVFLCLVLGLGYKVVVSF